MRVRGASAPKALCAVHAGLRGRRGPGGTPAPGFSASAGSAASSAPLCRLPAPVTPRQSCSVSQGGQAAPGLVESPPPLEDSEAIPAGLTWATPWVPG